MYGCHEANRRRVINSPVAKTLERHLLAKRSSVGWGCATVPSSSSFTRPITAAWPRKKGRTVDHWVAMGFCNVRSGHVTHHIGNYLESQEQHWFLAGFQKSKSKKTVGWWAHATASICKLDLHFGMWGIHGSQAPSTCTCSWSWPWGVNFMPRALGWWLP